MLTQEKKLNEIVRLSSELNDVQDLDILLEKILYEARHCVNADAGTIYIKNGDHLVFSHAQNDTKQKKLTVGQKLIYSTFKIKINKKSIAGYVAVTGDVLNIPDVYDISKNAPYNFDSSFDIISSYKTTSMLTVPLKTNTGEILGVLQIINAISEDNQFKPFDSEDELFVLHFASIASIVLQRAQMTRALILRMISMAELRDPKETSSHVNRVASYAVEIYEKWALQNHIVRSKIDKNRDVLRMAAMLHDVGKIAISDLILKKPTKFTNEEYEIMKSHTFLGARLFKQGESEFDEVSSLVALTHHENWDGTGYPGLIDITTGKPIEKDSKGNAAPRKGKDIPIFGRIISIADVFDALSSKRVYKEAMNEKSVLDEIRKLSGKKFDPELVEIFFDSIDILKSISEKYSNN